MTNRTFYRTIVTIEVLSEEPYPDVDLNSIGNIQYDVTIGHCSGSVSTDHQTMDGKTAAAALLSQGSDPEFFQIDENGNDLPEYARF